jgi:hypothetical protein
MNQELGSSGDDVQIVGRSLDSFVDLLGAWLPTVQSRVVLNYLIHILIEGSTIPAEACCESSATKVPFSVSNRVRTE